VSDFLGKERVRQANSLGDSMRCTKNEMLPRPGARFAVLAFFVGMPLI
jgi:hypothetical protein